MTKGKEYFINNKLQEEEALTSIDKKILDEVKLIIIDENYWEFINEVGNGGFFFNKSLHFYSLIAENSFRSIIDFNKSLSREFSFLFNGLYAFAQDIFGNQFVFDINTFEIHFFNIESGSKELLAENFSVFINVLLNDIEYYSGLTYEAEWNENNSIALNQRLQAKTPFVIGGDYKVNNFYVNTYPDYLSYSADIAKQIYNLKDGEKVRLKLKK
jgi:hypothetical protein